MARFQTTRWSLVLDARGASAEATRALEELCRIYRPPVLAYVRRHGHSASEAEDLTQAFFEQLLRARTFAAADRARGRLRVFLRVALNHFLVNQAAMAQAAKRGGGQRPASLDAQPGSCIEPAHGDTPDAVFEREWAATVLREALLRLEAEVAPGKRELFLALRPFLLEPPCADDYARVAERLGLRRNTIAVGIHRLRQRLHEVVRAELRETVADPAAVDTELDVLRDALGQREPAA